MEPRHAYVHLLCDLDRAAAMSRALQSDISSMNEIVVDALSVDYPHVAREKCDVLATTYIPRRIEAIREQLDRAREMIAIAF